MNSKKGEQILFNKKLTACGWRERERERERDFRWAFVMAIVADVWQSSSLSRCYQIAIRRKNFDWKRQNTAANLERLSGGECSIENLSIGSNGSLQWCSLAGATRPVASVPGIEKLKINIVQWRWDFNLKTFNKKVNYFAWRCWSRWN